MEDHYPDSVERVRLLVQEVLTIDALSSDTDLFESRLIDSLGLVSLIAEVEEQIEITIELAELDLDHFRSVDRIAEFVTATTTGATAHRSAAN